MKPSSGEYAPVEMQITSQMERSDNAIRGSDFAAASAAFAVAASTVRSMSLPPCGVIRAGLESDKRTSKSRTAASRAGAREFPTFHLARASSLRCRWDQQPQYDPIGTV